MNNCRNLDLVKGHKNSDSDTLISFGKFGEITVLMEQNVILTQNQVISTQWTLKGPQKLLKAQFFFKGQI